MLLHINALNQLQQGERRRADNILRWTSARNNEIERDGWFKKELILDYIT
nr:hypothetical protein [Campylobacter estrildidarum]